MIPPDARRLEPGPWLEGGEKLDGPGVRAQLCADRQAGRWRQPYCVYVHVPFCASICTYCALYTLPIRPGGDGRLGEYVDAVSADLDTHPWRGAPSAPTTVHFGGGTPLSLGLVRFGTLVERLRETFGTSPSCEWAVETTSRSLDHETVSGLAQLGVRRIHVGVQTLHEATRLRIGRQESGAQVVARIVDATALGCSVSADLIIGFDGVGCETVETDVRRLYDAGVRMFSVCELRGRKEMRLGAHEDRERARHRHALWIAMWSVMEDVGLGPIHLGQFGRHQADNLYYTHPARGENCVAVGPYAHGCAGDLYYGNVLWPDYAMAVRAGAASFGPGVRHGEATRAARALERMLLAHRAPAGLLAETADAYPVAFPPILGAWLAGGLLVRVTGADDYTLSPDGSWFVGNMIEELRAAALATVGARPGRECVA